MTVNDVDLQDRHGKKHVSLYSILTTTAFVQTSKNLTVISLNNQIMKE